MATLVIVDGPNAVADAARRLESSGLFKLEALQHYFRTWFDLDRLVASKMFGRPVVETMAEKPSKPISEGLPDSQLGVRRRHFGIARNSLCEVAAAVDLAAAVGALSVVVAGELVGRMQRVATLLAGLLRWGARASLRRHARPRAPTQVMPRGPMGTRARTT